jgi:hypothetical protein
MINQITVSSFRKEEGAEDWRPILKRVNWWSFSLDLDIVKWAKAAKDGDVMEKDYFRSTERYIVTEHPGKPQELPSFNLTFINKCRTKEEMDVRASERN